jgi:hypothetical protein
VRVGLVAKDGAGRSEGSIESHFDESFEGDLVASCGAFNQVLVARQRKLSGSVAQLRVINHAPVHTPMTSARWARLGQFRWFTRPRSSRFETQSGVEGTEGDGVGGSAVCASARGSSAALTF